MSFKTSTASNTETYGRSKMPRATWRDGWMLFAGMEGAVYEGGNKYGGHVLLIWKCDEEGVYIRDPDDLTLQAPISWERFRAAEWGSYFYAIREGN